MKVWLSNHVAKPNSNLLLSDAFGDEFECRMTLGYVKMLKIGINFKRKKY